MHRKVREAIDAKQVAPYGSYESAIDRAGHYEQLWLKEHNRRAELATAHSRIKLGAPNAIDAGDRANFFCTACSYQWPCPTFEWANGRDFEPLRLSVKKPEQ